VPAISRADIAAVAAGFAPVIRELVARVDAVERRPLQEGPAGPKGEPGPVGPSGPAGDVPDVETVVALLVKPLKVFIAEEIGRAMAAIPKPIDGKDGAPGKDGVGFDGMLEEIEDDGRYVVRKYFLGDTLVKQFRHRTVTPIFRGVWDATTEYKQGDCVRYAGGTSIALRDTLGEKPTDGGKAWRLAAKPGMNGTNGTNGKDGKPGERGPQGPQGISYWQHDPQRVGGGG